MKYLSKIIFALSLSLFSNQASSMSYRVNDPEMENTGIKVEFERLKLNEFLDTFKGLDKKKKKTFEQFDIRKVTIENNNLIDYLINSEIEIPDELNSLGGYSISEDINNCYCNGVVCLGALGSVSIGALAAIHFVISNPSVFEAIQGLCMWGGYAILPLAVTCLGRSCAKSCTEKSKEDRDEEIINFFKENVIVPGETVIKAGATITKYLIAPSVSNNNNLIFTDVDNSENSISFDLPKINFNY
ncbi:hypothetical protein KJ644_03460 [Candidatus Dependentiae bacterium]|nr:hypothetical protein [Candidatus Dependentiae bacterium]MBU4387504.1 hypothetical protein [Candidatus Dependentiae bacterium]MCG2756308.1 hypothetical protein [Candidatus Dependentiae bacterium]